jgi:UDP-N-acetylmuramyl pentapeptide synthase
MSALAVPAFGDGGIYLSERNEFKDTIAPLLNATTTVLIKGSRSQSMEKLVSQIQDDAQ